MRKRPFKTRAPYSAAERAQTAKAIELWNQAGDLGGESQGVNHPAARAYFAARGIDCTLLPPMVAGAPRGLLPTTIRYHPSCPCVISLPDGGYKKLTPGPAILFQVQNAAGEMVAVHRIYLECDGSPKKRSDMPDAKLALGPLSGHAIRFGVPSPAVGGGVLILGEGPETVLACMVACGMVGWSTISAGGLTSIEIPQELTDPQVAAIHEILIAADHDRGGWWNDERTRARRFVRPGWNSAVAAAARLQLLHPVACRVAVPRHHVCPQLVLEGPSAVDVFGDPAPKADGTPRKGVDWLDVLAECGSDGLGAAQRGLMGARTIAELDDLEVLAAPSARKVMEEGLEGLLEKLEDEPEAPADFVAPHLLLPKHSADRARLVLERFFAPGCEVEDGRERLRSRGEEGRWTICYWIQSGMWLLYLGNRYVAIRDAEVSAAILDRLRGFFQQNKDGPAPVHLTVRAADDVRKAMEGYAGIRTTRLPMWAPSTFDEKGEARWGVTLDRLVDADGPNGEAAEGEGSDRHAGYVSTKDGLLDLEAFVENRVMVRPHTPRYISTALLNYHLPLEAIEQEVQRDPEGDDLGGGLAGAMWPQWSKFLADVFEDDAECIRALQQWFGYCLIEDTSLQAILLMPGPPGSGKSTIFDVLGVMIGRDAVASTDLMQLAEKNETYALLGRRVAQMTDAHTDQKSAHRTTEMLKRISGGDAVGVEGKFKDRDPSVQLNIKFMIACNTVPKLLDASGALCRRLVVVPTMKSFAKKPDRDLRRKLEAEIRGILVWALFGLRDLKKMAKFQQPECGARIIEQFRRLSSPMAAFLEDCCVASPESTVGEDVLYKLYQEYLEHNGNARPSKEQFFAQLQANVPGMQRCVSERIGYEGTWVIRGVRPLHAADPQRVELDRLVAESGPGVVQVRHIMGRREVLEFDWLPEEEPRYGRGSRGSASGNRYGGDGPVGPHQWGQEHVGEKPDDPARGSGSFGMW